jgi:hypothetical protein
MDINDWGGVGSGISGGMLDVEQARANRQQMAFKEIELEEKKRQQAEDNTIIPLEAIKPFFDKMPNLSGDMRQTATDMKLISNVGGKEGISKRNIKTLIGVYDSVNAFGERALKKTDQDLSFNINNLQKQLSETKKPEEQKAIQQKIAAMQKEQIGVFNNIAKLELTKKDLYKENMPESVEKWWTGRGPLIPIKIKEEEIKAGAKDKTKEVYGMTNGGGIVSKDKYGRAWVTYRGKEPVEYDKRFHGVILSKDLPQGTKFTTEHAEEYEFNNQSPEAKEKAYKTYFATGKVPTLSFRGRSKDQFSNGYNQWMVDNGLDVGEMVDARAGVSGYSSVKKTHELYSSRTRSFINTIDENVKTIKTLKEKYGQNWGKLVNKAANSLVSNTSGSGDLETLRLALKSLSGEMSKVEMGNLGMGETSVSAANFYEKIYNPNLDAKDLDIVLDGSVKLGNNRLRALNKERATISGLLKDAGNYATEKGEKEQSKEEENGETPPKKTRVKMPKKKVEEYRKKANEAVKNGLSPLDVAKEYKRITGEEY